MIVVLYVVLTSIYAFRRFMYFFWDEFEVESYGRIDGEGLTMCVGLSLLLSAFGGWLVGPLMILWSMIRYVFTSGLHLPKWLFMSVPAHERKRIKQESQMAKIRQLEREKREKDHRIKQLEREVLNV